MRFFLLLLTAGLVVAQESGSTDSGGTSGESASSNSILPSRDYCYADKACQNTSECVQESEDGSEGLCCQGKCVSRILPLPRGSACNDSDRCVGMCSMGDQCVNNICTGLFLNGCSCTSKDQCKGEVCSSSACTGGLGQGSACQGDSWCESGHCKDGTCLGEDMDLGDPCRQDSECDSGFCVNNKCSLATVGQPCDASFECVSGLYCDSSSKCATKKSNGMNCDDYDACESSSYCVWDLGYTQCAQKKAIGQPCENEDECANSACNFGMCTRSNSAPNGARCTSSGVCPTNSQCGVTPQSQNRSDYMCVADHSIPAGGNCTYSSSCPNYANCSNGLCSESYLGKTCTFNDSRYDSDICRYGLYCDCTGHCAEKEIPTLLLSCQYLFADLPEMGDDPTSLLKQSKAVQRQFANAYCCQMCIASPEFPALIGLDTQASGWQLDCQRLEVIPAQICSTTQPGKPLVLNCQSYTGSATTGAKASVLLLFLSSLTLFFF